MPDSGTISPTLTSAGCCARATPDNPNAAAPDSMPRRVRDVVVDLRWFIVIPFFGSMVCGSRAEIGPAHSVIRAQGLVASFESDAASFENVAVVGRFQRFRHALLDQEDCQFRLLTYVDQSLEDEIGYRGRQAHRWFVQHQKLGRGGKATPDREHLLLSSGQRSRELIAAFGQDWQPFEDAFDVLLP